MESINEQLEELDEEKDVNSLENNSLNVQDLNNMMQEINPSENIKSVTDNSDQEPHEIMNDVD